MKMRLNKTIKTLIILFLCICSTGCIKYNHEMKIHNNKSMDINILIATNSNYKEFYTEDKINDLKKLGYSISKYKKNNYKGLIVNYKIKNIDKISTSKNTKYTINSIRNKKPNNLFKIKKGFLKNEYKANFIFDSTDIDPILIEDNENTSLKYECDDGNIKIFKYGDEIEDGCHRIIENNTKDNELKFILKLNNKTKSNNANKTNKNELIWNLNSNGITKINFEFSLYNYLNIILTIIILGILLYMLIILTKK